MAKQPTGPIPRAFLRDLYARTGGKPFDAASDENPTFRRLREQGYIRLVDGRCGFERIKDGLAQWTEAAHTALFPEFVGAPPA